MTPAPLTPDDYRRARALAALDGFEVGDHEAAIAMSLLPAALDRIDALTEALRANVDFIGASPLEGALDRESNIRALLAGWPERGA